MLLCTKLGRKGNNLAISTLFNRPCSFQHMLKFSTWFSNMFSIHFKLENLKNLHSNCNWSHPKNWVESYLRMQHKQLNYSLHLYVWKNMKTTVENMLKISRCVENTFQSCVENVSKMSRHIEKTFQVMLKNVSKISRHVENVPKSPWCDCNVSLCINFEI